jgi:YjbE family integral membrane protein
VNLGAYFDPYLGSSLSSIASYLDPAFWGEDLRARFGDFSGTAFWLGVPQVVLINVLLSGDTAVVIAMACRELPPRQRAWGMALGAGTAAVLLIIFAFIVVPLLQLPYVKLIGGLALIYVAVKLLIPNAPDTQSVAPATHLWRVVRTVVMADIVLSLDNIIAVAAVAHGNLALLVIGVAISIPIVLVGSALITALLERFPLLIWAGAALLGWIAGDTIATDPAISAYLIAHFGESLAHAAVIAAAYAGSVLVIAAGALLRRRA